METVSVLVFGSLTSKNDLWVTKTKDDFSFFLWKLSSVSFEICSLLAEDAGSVHAKLSAILPDSRRLSWHDQVCK